MVARQDTRSLVKSAFPGHESLIDRAYRENGSFRDLCRDYRECAVALARWRGQSGAGPSARTREYTELLARLGRELEFCLRDMVESAAAPRRGGGQ